MTRAEGGGEGSDGGAKGVKGRQRRGDASMAVYPVYFFTLRSLNRCQTFVETLMRKGLELGVTRSSSECER